MKLRVLDDRVLIKPEEAASKSPGGILLPDNAQEKPLRGEVMAVGKGKTNDKGITIPMSVKVGDKVYYTRYGGNPIKEFDDMLVMREDDILAVITE